MLGCLVILGQGTPVGVPVATAFAQNNAPLPRVAGSAMMTPRPYLARMRPLRNTKGPKTLWEMDSVKMVIYRRDYFKQGLKQAKIGLDALNTPRFDAGLSLMLATPYPQGDGFALPLKRAGRIIFGSGFGLRDHPVAKMQRFHKGLDLPQPYGTPVYPSKNGWVIFAGWKVGYGLMVIIKHKDKTTTRYGHLSAISAFTGEYVQKEGKMIGRVGNTGLATGSHLHFEIRDRHGKPLNPYKQIALKIS